MKKFFTLLLMVGLLLSFNLIETKAVIEQVDYNVTFHEGYKWDIKTGQFVSDPNYMSTNRITIINNQITLTTDDFHQILFFDKNNNYLGYKNPIGSGGEIYDFYLGDTGAIVDIPQHATKFSFVALIINPIYVPDPNLNGLSLSYIFEDKNYFHLPNILLETYPSNVIYSVANKELYIPSRSSGTSKYAMVTVKPELAIADDLFYSQDRVYFQYYRRGYTFNEGTYNVLWGINVVETNWTYSNAYNVWSRFYPAWYKETTTTFYNGSTILDYSFTPNKLIFFGASEPDNQGSTFYNWINYNSNYINVTINVTQLGLDHLTDEEIYDYSQIYKSSLSAGENINPILFTAIQPTYEQEIIPPVDIVDRINNRFEDTFLGSAFGKALLSILLIVIFTIIFTIIGLPKLIILFIDGLLIMVFVALTWIPLWIIFALTFMIIGFLVFLNKGGNNND